MKLELPAAVRTHNLYLEGLRGLAALMVVYSHLSAPYPDVDAAYAPSARFWLVETGQGAVALFFVISGFVIGLTNDRPWSSSAAHSYLWRRFIRLVPLYVLAIAVSVLAHPVDSPKTILGNLLFLQNNGIHYGNLRVFTLAANPNLWSLNYEALYYALFLLIWRFRLPVFPLVVGGVAVTATGAYLPGLIPSFLTAYAAGWVFWMGGLWLAWEVRPTTMPRQPWPSLLLVFVLIWRMNILFYFLKRRGIVGIETTTFSLDRLDFVPICMVLVAITTGRSGRFLAVASRVCVLAPLLYCGWRAARHTFWAEPNYPLFTVLASAAVALWCWRPSLEFFARISLTGFICYGIYIFERPVQWFVRDHLRLPQGNAASYALRAILTVALTLTVAFLAELRLRPWLRARLERRPLRVSSLP